MSENEETTIGTLNNGVRVLRPEEVIAERLTKLEKRVQKLESRDAAYGPIPMPCPNHRSLDGRNAAKSSDAPTPPHLQPVKYPDPNPCSQPTLQSLFHMQRNKIAELEMRVQSQARHISNLEREIETLRTSGE